MFAGEAYLFRFGAVGVHIFFVISGFIMVHTSRTEPSFDAKSFLRRRLLRIYPIYWICAALYVIAHFAIEQPFFLSGAEWIGALLLWPGQASKIIGPAWTLSFEMYFYVCFGLFILFGLTRGLLGLGAFFLVCIFVRPLTGFQSSPTNLASNPLLIEFLAGCVIGWLLKTGRLPKRGGNLAIVGALFLYLGGIVVGYERVPSLIAWGPPSALLILGVAIIESARGAHSSVRRIGYFGDSSYALYLIHILIITLIISAVGAARVQTLPAIPGAILITILSLAAAESLHWGLERPLLRRLNPRRALVPPRPILEIEGSEVRGSGPE